MFDANPPSPDILNKVYPEVTLAAYSLEAKKPVIVRQWEKNYTYSYGFSLNLKADMSGRFLSKLIFEELDSVARIAIYQDKNENGMLDTTDVGFLSNTFSLKATQTVIANNWTNPYTITASGTWNASSKYFCFFAPSGFLPFDYSYDKYLDRELKKEGKPLSDMAPLIFTTDAAGSPTVTQSVALLPEVYSVQCLLDVDHSNTYSGADTIITVPNITVTGPVGVVP
ncbi:MAG: hypothetical protein D6767_08175 [Candidatus Hydrogenedentota bacterium]|nr:MAG: hypothetical protein D6767_08175 [Candidatus Hydrogenedentota bacterium]